MLTGTPLDCAAVTSLSATHLLCRYPPYSDPLWSSVSCSCTPLMPYESEQRKYAEARDEMHRLDPGASCQPEDFLRAQHVHRLQPLVRVRSN